jgi:hypothetical protein
MPAHWASLLAVYPFMSHRVQLPYTFRRSTYPGVDAPLQRVFTRMDYIRALATPCSYSQWLWLLSPRRVFACKPVRILFLFFICSISCSISCLSILYWFRRVMSSCLAMINPSVSPILFLATSNSSTARFFLTALA